MRRLGKKPANIAFIIPPFRRAVKKSSFTPRAGLPIMPPRMVCSEDRRSPTCTDSTQHGLHESGFDDEAILDCRSGVDILASLGDDGGLPGIGRWDWVQTRSASQVHGPGASESAAKPTEERAKSDAKTPSGREVLDRMVAAYRKASTYADAGTVRLLAEAGEKKIDNTADFSTALVRPNKLRVQAYAATLVCDGQKLCAKVSDVPGGVGQRAPARLTLKSLDMDMVVRMAMNEGFGGATPQPLLLLADQPLDALLRDSEEPVLSQSGQIDGRDCYRVQVKTSYGMATFWIDQETYVLRRLVLPTDQIRQELSQEQLVERLSLVADFAGAQIDGKVEPKAFEFEMPKGDEVVKFLIPPQTAQLLGKKVPALEVLRPRRQARHARVAGRQDRRARFLGHVVWAVQAEPAEPGEGAATLPRQPQSGVLRRERR